MKQKKHIVYGPPGTGKTTYLLDLLENCLETYSPEEIAYVSFTRQGTYEGVKRARKKFNITEKQAKYFKTIHSLCFKALGMTRAEMISRKHYRLFSEKTGIYFSGFYTEEFKCENDKYLHTVSMEKHNRQKAFQMSKDLQEHKLDYIRFQYTQLKKQLGVLDFDDLLLNYVKSGETLPIKVAFIDEAQDLTPLQWAVVNKLFRECKLIYAAGDDDQAVYEWAGASVTKFLNFSKNVTVLDKSYRLPSRIAALARTIVSDISVRQDKQFLPRKHEGKVLAANSMVNVEFKGGELVLARTNSLLRDYAAQLEELGIPYRLKGIPNIKPMVTRAISAYILFTQGDVEDSKVSDYSSFFDSISSDIPWFEALKEEFNPPAYARAWNNIKQKPVLLETFHSCKGSENNHVIVSTDISRTIEQNYFRSPDSELRCLYVAVTRTLDKLTVLSPASELHYKSKYFKEQHYGFNK